MQAMLCPPMACTSCATAMLETVARPMWLSGIRKVLDTAVSTPIWWRACVRSGRTGGSISQTISNGRALMTGFLRQVGVGGGTGADLLDPHRRGLHPGQQRVQAVRAAELDADQRRAGFPVVALDVFEQRDVVVRAKHLIEEPAQRAGLLRELDEEVVLQPA